MIYVLKAVTPDGRKVEWEHHCKKTLEDTRRACLEMGFRRASIKKRRKNERANIRSRSQKSEE